MRISKWAWNISFVSLVLVVVVFARLLIVVAADVSLGFSQSPRSFPVSIDLALFSKGKNNIALSQAYGKTSFALTHYLKHFHNGIDIAVPYGAAVIAISHGVVLAVGDQDQYCFHRGYGKFVVMYDQDREAVLLYAHLGSIYAKQGDEVKQGDALGTIGSSGFETGPHLHFSTFTTDNFSMTQKGACGPTPQGDDFDPTGYLQRF